MTMAIGFTADSRPDYRDRRDAIAMNQLATSRRLRITYAA
jgi:hypothetical protein